ncbi:MAG TPA: polysaccharide biosynthesis tyrosine autokinase [Pyrinomonadaceae bacterium]|nr:polysaccharide biosynthesis tyrosine autokinase [Pyrinomonadaceae bacterium]
MIQDERLIPANRNLDRTLTDLAQSKPYGKYDKYTGAQTETNLREYFFVVLKRKWLILSLVLVVTSLVTVQAYRQPSIYEGATTIRIEAKPQSPLQTGGIIINTAPDPSFWNTQLKLLENPSLARQVILTLNLQKDPAFVGGQAQSSIFASLKRIFSRDKPVVPATSSGTENQPVGEEQMKERQFTAEELAGLEPYEDAITGNLTVEPVIGTNLVNIRYRHTNPALAQKIANTLADVFVTNNLERQELGNSKAETLLMQEIAKYQDKIKREGDARFAFARDNDLPLDNTLGNNLEQVRAQTYSQQLLTAENERRNKLAAYEAAKNAADPFSNPTVQKDERIIELRKKLSDLRDKETALLQKYTPEWPDVKQIQAQIKQVEGELAQAPKEVMASMKAAADAAEKQQKSLETSYIKAHNVTTQQTKNIVQLAAMTQELTTDQQYLNTLLQKRRELSATSGQGGTSVSVSNYGRLPREPVGPARLRNIVIAFILALSAGIGLAFLLDFLDDTVKTVDDVDRYIHLPALALIPAARSEKGLRGEPAPNPNDATALAMVTDVRSPIAESYRHLRTSLLLSSAGTPPRTILVTSSQPSEGKTTTAINTAFMLAQTGAQVLIIDCDLRRPRLHAHFNLSNVRGLTNCLSGESNDLDSLIQTYDKQPNLKLMPSGPIPPNPAELLGSEEMRKLLVTLSGKFTHIIVDSPPAISFTDASILSTFVDGVILVVHGGRSSRAVVRRAKQQLLDVGAHIFGVVLNNVKIESHDYYYAGYYSGYYRSDYYNDEEDGAAADQNTTPASS